LPVRRNRRFGLLWLSGLLSSAGDWLLIVAVPVYVFTMTGSTLTSGLAFVAQVLPALLFAAPAGALVDRWDRRTVMVAADLLRMLIVLVLLTVDREGSLWRLYAALFAESAVGQFFQPAARAAIPAVVGRGTELESANSWTTVAGGVVRLAGAPAGGALYALVGFDGLVLIDAATYLTSGLLILLVGRLRPVIAGGTEDDRLRSRIRAGLQFLYAHPVLRTLLGVSSLFLLANAGLNVLLVPYILDRLGGGSRAVGLMMSALGVGFLLSAYAGNRLSRTGRLRASVGGCLAAVTVFFGGLFLIADLRSALVFIALIGVPGGAVLMLVQVQLQRQVPDGTLGRVGAAFAAVEMAATAVGGAAGSVLGDRLPFTLTVAMALAVSASAALLAVLRLPARVPAAAPSPL
jgi:predicted MFS family arabinose efflux permease